MKMVGAFYPYTTEPLVCYVSATYNDAGIFLGNLKELVAFDTNNHYSISVSIIYLLHKICFKSWTKA